ncbi:hypothetical protein [Candidatus Propionivibrio aalborgensis]
MTPGTIPLEIIEVQLGGFMNEDRNARTEDSYCR